MPPKINARWYKATFNILSGVKSDLDVVEFDNKTYCYAGSALTNDMVEKSNLWVNAITHQDLFGVWKNTIMADCVSRKIKPDWKSTESTQEVAIPIVALKCQCGRDKIGAGYHSDWCPLATSLL